MIEKKVLDEILPVPEIAELKESIQEELIQEGFAITNFNSGGIFYTLMMILIWIRIELIKLLRYVLNNMFISHAEGAWLELKAADFSKKRKQPTKTRGYVTIKRSEAGNAVKIAKGHVFKTEQDINGEELRFIAVEDTIMPKLVLNQLVLVEAEKEGAIYNVPAGQIKKSLIHISGIEEISNEADWIVREGSDLEDIESLRSRTLNSWAELSTLPISTKLKNVAESVDGVLFATVDDLHPRGQGTIDIIVTSTAGQATEYLLEQVRTAVDAIKSPYDNILVKSSETVLQEITAILYIDNSTIEDGIIERANSILVELLKINKGRNLNELYVLDISFALKKELPLKNVKILVPTVDVLLASDKVILLGEINISIQRV